MADDPALLDRLSELGARDDEAFDLSEAALLLAALDRPRVDLARYRDHLAELAGELASLDHAEPLRDLVAVLADRHGYRGDRLTYDDMQNANLMRVIDRRKGLPVALSILYLHAARAQGWHADGINFPAHFLVRIDAGTARGLLDPFSQGRQLAPDEVRGLLKQVAGADAELRPEFTAAVADRDLVLRLLNNIKVRALRAEDAERALTIVERMRRVAPDRAVLCREQGLLAAGLGRLQQASAAIARYGELAASDAERHDAAALAQQLRRGLN